VRARLIAAVGVMAAALLGATSLLTYNPWRTAHYFDYGGDMHSWTVSIRERPWWSAYAALGLIVLGVAIAAKLLPEAGTRVRGDAQRLWHALVARTHSLVRRAIAHSPRPHQR
jgi:hypothetical protein